MDGSGGPGASAAAATATAERRLVSIIFADLVGFTPFAEERDSEDVRDVLTRYFDLASDVIGRYGGTVEKFIGDAVMAVWGTPTAREDDAERAVRAALDLVDAVRDLSPAVQARCGVLTGEAAVTLNARNQGMVAGDIVNTAARLQSVAAPGTVLVGESTYRAASRAIAFEAAGEQTLKGKQAPVPAWRAVRVVAERGGRRRSETLEAPFVGRDVELRLLKDLFHATSAERRVRHVSVLGSGGVGKSRLAWEFEKYLDGIAERVWWHEGRSPAYGEGITFWAIGEMIRSRAQLADTDDEATTRTRIAAMLDTHLPGDPDRRWIEDALLELVGIRTGAASDELFGAWRTFFERMAATGPVLLVFQDLHWADPGTLDFIDHLVEWSRGSPILILSLARPELLGRRPNWGAGQRGFTSLHLEPLPEEPMRSLLSGLVADLPDATCEAIVGRAEGIPFYAIETIRMLVTNGQLTVDPDGRYRPIGDLQEVAVPETLTALVAARLDALEPADRQVLLDAAVLGHSFTPMALAAVTGLDHGELEGRLRTLASRELLHPAADSRSPERGQYAFVQALIREVTYNTLSKKDRKTRHLAAARWFESLGEPELAGALAGHYLSARENASEGPEADALATQARIALRAAGERAASLGAHAQAITFFEQAIGVTSDPDEAADLRLRAGDSAATIAAYEKVETHYEAAIERFEARGDRRAKAAAIGAYGQALVTGRRTEHARALLEGGAAEFADLGDDAGRLHIVGQLARLHGRTSEPTLALELIEPVLLAAERTMELLTLADGLTTKGGCLVALGRRHEGLALLDAGQRLAELNGFSYVRFRALSNGLSSRSDDDPRAAFDDTVAGMALARRVGEGVWARNFAGTNGYISLRVGEWAAGMAEMTSALTDITDPMERLVLVNNLANLQLLMGDEAAAAASVAELEATVGLDPGPDIVTFRDETLAWQAFAAGDLRDSMERWELQSALDAASAPGYGHAVRLAIWLDDLGRARADLLLFDGQPAKTGAVRAWRIGLEAGILGLEGDHAAAAAAYREALRLAREMRLVLDEALLGIDMAYVLGPDDPLAAEAIAGSRRILGALRATPVLRLLDEAVAKGPHPRLRDAAASSSGATDARQGVSEAVRG